MFDEELDRPVAGWLFVDEVVMDGVVKVDVGEEVEDVNVCSVLDDADADDTTAEEILAWEVDAVAVGVVGVGVILPELALEVLSVAEVVVVVGFWANTRGDRLESFTGWALPSRFTCHVRSRRSARRRDSECIVFTRELFTARYLFGWSAERLRLACVW